MQCWLFIAAVIALGVAVAVAAIPDVRERKRRLGRYWARICTGREWRRRFPDVPKDEIRRFLDVFIDAFAFKDSQRLKFSPDDKVYEVYRSLYPALGWADSMELETVLPTILRDNRPGK